MSRIYTHPDWCCPYCGSTEYKHMTDFIFRCADCWYDISETLPETEAERVQGRTVPTASVSGSVPPEQGVASPPDLRQRPAHPREAA